jgi:F0F1-type ATP synthase membrane subunit b/b'
MSIETLLENIEDILETSKNAPFSSKLAVDGDEIKRIIEDIRLNMPDELMKARKIASERKEILDAAQVTADGIIADAHKQAEDIVSEHEITKLAENNANEILQEARTQATEIIEQARETAADLSEQAQKWSTDLRRSAGEYVENIVATADEALTASVNEIRKARMSLRNASSQNKTE